MIGLTQIKEKEFKDLTEGDKRKLINELIMNWQNTFANLEKWNKELNGFTLNHIEVKEYGFSCRIYAPWGMDLNDLENAMVLQLNQRLRAEKADKGHETVADIKRNLADIANFVAKFFDNQFTADQAIIGLAPNQGLEIDTFVMAALGESVDTDNDPDDAENENTETKK